MQEINKVLDDIKKAGDQIRDFPEAAKNSIMQKLIDVKYDFLQLSKTEPTPNKMVEKNPVNVCESCQ